MKEVVRKEILKLLEAGIIYPVADSDWVSVHCVPKKEGITVVPNDKDELIHQRIITSYRMVIDFRKLNKATKKDHYPLHFYRSNARKIIQTYTFLLSRWLFWFLSNTRVSGGSIKNYFYLPFWYFCL